MAFTVRVLWLRAADFDTSYRGLNNYLYYFGDSSLLLWYNGPQNPSLIISAPILCPEDLWIVQPAAGNPPDRAVQPHGTRGQGLRGLELRKVLDVLTRV